MTLRPWSTCVALAAVAGLACGAVRAEVTLQNAWLRPAYAGQPQAQLYLDIVSTEPLKLVGARSPAAQEAKLVVVDPPDPDPARARIVAEIPIAAKRETRLAYLESHIRLVDVRGDLAPGARVPFELTFSDASAKQRTVAGEAIVRGLMARRPADGSAPDRSKP